MSHAPSASFAKRHGMTSSKDSAPAFALHEVTVDFQSTRALNNVSLEISSGEHVALIGPSGSGKTTLLRTLNGSQSLTSGEVYVNGQALTGLASKDLRNIRRSIGWIPQSLGLVPNLRVAQNLMLGSSGRASLWDLLRKLTFPSRADQLSALEHLDRVGVGEKLFERTSSLSGGQQQRVAIARTLFQNPTSILADEPVSAVDPARAVDLVKLLTELATENGVSLVMSIHNLELARRFFPRLIGLRSGKVIVDSRPDDLSQAEADSLFSLTKAEILSGE